MHHILLDSYTPGSGHLTLDGEEARHAVRVKRLREGAQVRVLDGKGTIALCRVEIASRTLELAVLEEHIADKPRPAIRVMAATPKGQRLEKMIDALVQVGAASWQPLETKLGVVDPGAGKLNRIERIAHEALKQSTRPWAMELGRKAGFVEAIAPADRTGIVLADASGDSYRATGSENIRLLIGPEGGWTDEEIASARDAGAQVSNFGLHAMRIEIAAPMATGHILLLENT